MARANPERSFESAARHLFRHINDIEALHRNPLLRSLFDELAGEAEPVILRRIHETVLVAARLSADARTTLSGTRAQRQDEIVRALCAGEPPAKTAARLGISIHYYYRERRSIGNALSRALLEETLHRSKRFEIADPLRLLFTRAATLRDQGLAGMSVSILETALAESSDDESRAALRSELARSFMSFGRSDLAAKLVDESKHSADLQNGDARGEWVHNHQLLTRTLLAMSDAGRTDAGMSLEILARSHIKRRQVDEEALDTIIECGDWHCQTGLFDEARKMLDHARELGKQIAHIPPRQQSAIALLAAHCAQEACDEFDLEYHWLNEALALSISNGSVRGILGATAGLMQYCLSAQRDEWVYGLAQEGLRIAKGTEGSALVGHFALQISGALLRTRYWRAVDPLIFEAEALLDPGSLRWAYLKEFQGLFLMRADQNEKAGIILAEAYAGARKVNNSWLEGIALRDLSMTRHRRGSVNEAVDLMKEALQLLEGRSGIVSLGATYDAAARILVDRRLARLAYQIKAELSARARKLRLQSRNGARMALSERWRLPVGRKPLSINS
jgi:tetratricopeptide (TPR) repeat protein